LGDEPHNAASRAQAHLAEILAMALIEKRIIDREVLCSELEGLASIRRSEGHDVMAAGLASLAVSLRAIARG
jgi:hypothetical protein